MVVLLAVTERNSRDRKECAASPSRASRSLYHTVVHLNVSVTPDPTGPTPSDVNLFITIRQIDPSGQEVFYTGTAGNRMTVTKGWLRTSLRQVDQQHCEWLPHRNYTSKDILPVVQGEIYAVDIEVWPTNGVVEKGGKLMF